MATLASDKLTLLDWAQRLDPGGKSIAMIIELLAQKNEMLQDIPWIEANGPTYHRTTVRTGLPTVSWRLLNSGVLPSKSTTVQVDDTMGFLEGYSKLDKALAELNGMTPSFRLSEDSAFLEAMSQEWASTFWYGNTGVDPEKFLGMAPRFSSLSAQNGSNIIDGGSNDTDNTSIWLIGWGPQTVHGIFPRGSQAGLKMTDLGEDTNVASDGKEHQILRTHFKWAAGITVRDWRYVVRIPNIEVSDLTKDGATGADLFDLMGQALEKIHSLDGCTPVWYMNRTVRSFLRRQASQAVKNSTLAVNQVGGQKPVLMVGEVPVRRSDALINAEAAVA